MVLYTQASFLKVLPIQPCEGAKQDPLFWGWPWVLAHGRRVSSVSTLLWTIERSDKGICEEGVSRCPQRFQKPTVWLDSRALPAPDGQAMS